VLNAYAPPYAANAPAPIIPANLAYSLPLNLLPTSLSELYKSK
jgi:hypothetical protein